MILLVNCFITEDPLIHYHRGHMHRDDNFDVLKYTISSLAVVDRWSLALFHIRLDDCYKDREEELHNHITHEFGGRCDTIAYDWRCEYQSQWKDLISRLDKESDPYIWFTCNHDHLFTDYGCEALDTALVALDNDPEERKAIQYSHWPEYNRQQQTLFPNDFRVLPCGTTQGRDNRRESIQILSKPLLHSWMVEPDFGDRYIPRSNWYDPDTVYSTPYRSFAPFREIGRHYDSYSHLFDIGVVPAITIPPGFFENDIKIRYGYPDNKEGWVNINPFRPYRTVDPDGVDYKCVLEDLPLFWKGRVKEIDESGVYSKEELLEGRNKAVQEYITCFSPHRDLGGCLPPEDYVARSMR